MNKTKIIKEELKSEEKPTEREQQLAIELQLISLLRENTNILHRHPELLAVLEVPHQSGKAVSLIERQVTVLRQQIQIQDDHLRELMDVARDNERLANIRQTLALNLLSAHDLDDVINLVLDMLRNELSADYAVVKLFTEEQQRIEQFSGLFIDVNAASLKVFKTMLQQKNIVCGKASDDQKDILFDEAAGDISSAAIIPLVAGANLGLIGLGANDVERFKSSMGTDFLTQIGDLISASLALHMEA